MNMKLRNIKEVEEFRKVIHNCTGDVYLKSQDGDVFNLKSALSEYIALGQLLSEQGDNLTVPLQTYVDKELFGGTQYAPVKIVKASLGSKAGAYGAAALAMKVDL